ncbi:MAG: 30S ribosomal protein S18 [Planctomycetota bacterium]|jgi:small subunit ribosomal protein S18
MSRFDRFSSQDTKVVTTSSNQTRFIDYKDSEALRRLLSPNGKIYGRKRTGLSAGDQRMAATAIKRARYMGLLPYTSATL